MSERIVTIEDIARRCKASVTLKANDHQSVYETIPQWLEDEGRFHEFKEGEWTALCAAETVWTLQFYPQTPIGFYRLYGTSAQDVIDRADRILTEQEGL